MYSVYQPWDKLKTCIVGKSYPPEFYSFITDPRVRNVMERIAIETEEDYQKFIKLLESFKVQVLRPNIEKSIDYYKVGDVFIPPPMAPADVSIMIGNKLYYRKSKDLFSYRNILKYVKNNGNEIKNNIFVSNSNTSRIGKDLYFGTFSDNTLDNTIFTSSRINEFSQEYRCHFINSEGHSDAVFCPVVPGLILSLNDIQDYKVTFPDWEVVFLPESNLNKDDNFIKMKRKNNGKWWIPGEEDNDQFIEFVENFLPDWLGYVEESVFDINIIAIDKKNVVCLNYNKQVFDAFERYGITPHIINFRHSLFWDCGLHCITSDLDREGNMEDYFPERGSESIIS